MSGRFGRASKFRHVFPTAAKKEKSYTELRSNFPGDGNLIECNELFFAVGGSGGGGPLMIHKVGDFGRFGASHPCVNVHSSNLCDFAFHPFDPTLIATGAEDCTVKVTKIPVEGLTADITSASVTLDGHQKRIGLIHFSPTANHLLASCAYDNSIKLWDIEKGTNVLSYNDFPEQIFSFEWNHDSSMMAAFCRDKQIRFFDPRAAAATTTLKTFEGNKQARGIFLPDKHSFVGIGFSKTATRQIQFWDYRNLSAAGYGQELDQAAGAVIPYYDVDTSILYLTGKGDGMIRYYEIIDEAVPMSLISEYRSSDPNKGAAFLPKRMLDTTCCEIALCLRLTKTSVEPVSFQVPRKSDQFQKDIYPQTYAGKPSCSVDEYIGGANPAPIMVDIVPSAQRPGYVPPAVTFTPPPPKEEKKEVPATPAAMQAEIAELRAELAKAKAEIARLQGAAGAAAGAPSA